MKQANFMGKTLFLVFFLISFPLKAINIESTFNQIRIELLKNESLEHIQERICSRGKMCANLKTTPYANSKETPCKNQSLFSLCYLICEHQEEGFKKSHCFKTTISDGFEATEGQFKNGKKPLTYLVDVTRLPGKNHFDEYILCEVLCRTLRDTNLSRFLKGAEVELRKACEEGCNIQVMVEP